jgi:hypothetical protein
LLQCENSLPQYRRRRSLSRFPLIHHSLPRRPNPSCQCVLRQVQPTTQMSQVVVIVVGNNRQGHRTEFLTAKAPVMACEKSLSRGSRGGPNRAAERRPYAEARVEPAGSSGCLQGPDVYTKFLCELGERQELVLVLVTDHGFGRAVEHGGRNRSTSAVPAAQRLEWDRQQLGKFALTESCRSAQLAKRVHPAHTMVFVASPSQATSGISGQ